MLPAYLWGLICLNFFKVYIHFKSMQMINFHFERLWQNEQTHGDTIRLRNRNEPYSLQIIRPYTFPMLGFILLDLYINEKL